MATSFLKRVSRYFFITNVDVVNAKSGKILTSVEKFIYKTVNVLLALALYCVLGYITYRIIISFDDPLAYAVAFVIGFLFFMRKS